jgi:hypothetical protein
MKQCFRAHGRGRLSRAGLRGPAFGLAWPRGQATANANDDENINKRSVSHLAHPQQLTMPGDDATWTLRGDGNDGIAGSAALGHNSALRIVWW